MDYVSLSRSKPEDKEFIKKSRVKKDYLNATITEEKKIYHTNKLTEEEVEELKEMGYGFIFK